MGGCICGCIGEAFDGWPVGGDAAAWLLLPLGEAMFCLGCFAGSGRPGGFDGDLRGFLGDMLAELAVCDKENLGHSECH